jgi:hypothetical protein
MGVSVAFLLPAVALFLVGCEEKMPKGDPAQQVSPGRAGTRAGWDIALDLSMKPHFIQILVSGFKHEHHALPKSIGYVLDIPNCVYAGPEAGSKVVYLTASRGQISSNIHTFNTKEVREAAEQFVKDWRTAGEERRVGLSSSLAPLAIMNVVVTDTSAPIHLVLGGPKAVFNLQLAPGARVSGVSLIGVEDIGVANLPDGVPLNAMGPAAVKRCGAEPFMRPKPDWQVWRLGQEATPSSREALANRNRLHARFDGFFRSSFGQGSETTMIGGEYLGHFLIGPAPQGLPQRFPFKSLTTATLLMTKPDHIALGDKEELRKVLTVQVRSVAQTLVSGPLASLNRK